MGHDLAVAATRLLPRHDHLAIVGDPHPRAYGDPTVDLLQNSRANVGGEVLAAYQALRGTSRPPLQLFHSPAPPWHGVRPDPGGNRLRGRAARRSTGCH